MARKKTTWRDRFPEEVTCVRCLEVQPLVDVDRLLWCNDCCASARNRAAWWGWLGVLIFGGAISLYIWIVIRPTDLVIGGWFGTVAMAMWLGAKACREIVYGIMRFSNGRAVDAVPPSLTELEE